MFLPMILRVDYETSRLVVRVHGDEGVAVISVEIVEGHSTIDDQRLFPLALRPFRVSTEMITTAVRHTFDGTGVTTRTITNDAT